MTIPYAPNYCITRSGRVWSKHFKRYRTVADNGNGYKYVSLRVNDKSVVKYVHRLVGEHFIPNPHNYPEINHIDHNKANNHVSNLEWCTRQMNSRHSHGHEDYMEDDYIKKDVQTRFNNYINDGVEIETALYAID